MTSATQKPGPVITDNIAASRLEAVVEGHLCVLDYRRLDGTLHIDHVGVPLPVRGRGIAAVLTEAAMHLAREHGLRVAPHCSYAAAWFRRHPHQADRADY